MSAGNYGAIFCITGCTVVQAPC